MSRIVLNGDVAEQLRHLYSPVELCDASGRVLGQFVPPRDIAEYEPLTPEISEEELERRRHSKEKRYTTAEVLAHLEKLG